MGNPHGANFLVADKFMNVPKGASRKISLFQLSNTVMFLLEEKIYILLFE
jgi:hypothetical protein